MQPANRPSSSHNNRAFYSLLLPTPFHSCHPLTLLWAVDLVMK